MFFFHYQLSATHCQNCCTLNVEFVLHCTITRNAHSNLISFIGPVAEMANYQNSLSFFSLLFFFFFFFLQIIPMLYWTTLLCLFFLFPCILMQTLGIDHGCNHIGGNLRTAIYSSPHICNWFNLAMIIISFHGQSHGVIQGVVNIQTTLVSWDKKFTCSPGEHFKCGAPWSMLK